MSVVTPGEILDYYDGLLVFEASDAAGGEWHIVRTNGDPGASLILEWQASVIREAE